MIIIQEVKEMKNKINTINGKQIGFVPTMGYFHEGHLTLMQQAKKDNDIVIASIFVNPLQFGANEDYDKYPRDSKRDITLAEKNGVDILFMPSVSDIYPNKMTVTLAINDRASVLCGRSRPGHFEGVITVLTKLFHIVQPTRTYFGLKDAQQVAVVDALITDLHFPIELVGLPTIREEDGLAKSSRNVNLSKVERKEAPALYKALMYGQKLVVDGEKNPVTIVKEIKALIQKETSGQIDYVEIRSYPTLKPISVIDKRVILAVAVQFKQARLIDNIIFDRDGTIFKEHKQEEV